eukprot:14489032-Alexandrium_andersonii.AAC.1
MCWRTLELVPPAGGPGGRGHGQGLRPGPVLRGSSLDDGPALAAAAVAAVAQRRVPFASAPLVMSRACVPDPLNS